MTERPLVAILCLRDSAHAEPEARLEQEAIGDAAVVKTFPLPDRPRPEDFPAEVWDAAAIIIWHSLPVGEALVARFRRCRALIRNGVGFDSIDLPGRGGTATALRAKALGFRVICHDPHVPAGTHKAVGIARVDTLDELLQSSDVVSIHCYLSGETRGLIGERELALMKPTAYLVNTVRGEPVRNRVN